MTDHAVPDSLDDCGNRYIGTFARGDYSPGLDLFKETSGLTGARAGSFWPVVGGLAEVGICGDEQLVRQGYSLNTARELE